MISVGIDVSKEKSTICILKPYGEIVSKPFEVCHTEKELSELTSMLLRLNDDVRVVMEATGIYHLPVLCYLKEKGLFVAVVNPFEMKEYRCQGLDVYKRQVLGGYHSDVTAIVTEDERRQRELREAKEAAERANVAKTSFLSRMSHDIRTPLKDVYKRQEYSEKDYVSAKRRAICIIGYRKSKVKYMSVQGNAKT